MGTKRFMNMTPGNARIMATANQVNCWVCVGKRWYTIAEFTKELGASHLRTDDIKLRNPLMAVKESCLIIGGMIETGKSVEQVKDATNKLNEFINKIAASGYKPFSHQRDNVDLF